MGEKTANIIEFIENTGFVGVHKPKNVNAKPILLAKSIIEIVFGFLLWILSLTTAEASNSEQPVLNLFEWSLLVLYSFIILLAIATIVAIFGKYAKVLEKIHTTNVIYYTVVGALLTMIAIFLAIFMIVSLFFGKNSHLLLIMVLACMTLAYGTLNYATWTNGVLEAVVAFNHVGGVMASKLTESQSDLTDPVV